MGRVCSKTYEKKHSARHKGLPGAGCAPCIQPFILVPVCAALSSIGNSMDNLIAAQVRRIHDSPTMAVVAVAGGGARALGWLLEEPGASRTILEALAPYSPETLSGFLGYEPVHVVTPDTAKDMARSAYERALLFRHGDLPVAGIACTAAIATDRPKRGGHRCYVAAWTERTTTTFGLAFVKGLRGRGGEDEIVSKLVVRALAEASGIDFDLPLTLDSREHLEVTTVAHEDPVKQVLVSTVTTATVHADGTMAAGEAVRGGILPGSFNPLHAGHEKLAEVASKVLEDGVIFELSVTNVDKPPLEETEVQKRLSQFAGRWPVVVTRAPVYHEKARLFPGCTFVVGWDTAARVVDARYSRGDRSRMIAALDEIRRLGCRFLVAGREEDGVFHKLDDIDVPAGFEDMFTPVPESAFRCDVSSTQLRATGRRA